MREARRYEVLSMVALAGVFLSSAAMASAGGRYDREPPKLTTQAQQLEAEQRSKAAWETLRQRVPDLHEDESSAAKAAMVPKPQALRPEARVCERIATVGSKIKRRVCRHPKVGYKRQRDDMLTRQVYSWGNP